MGHLELHKLSNFAESPFSHAKVPVWLHFSHSVCGADLHTLKPESTMGKGEHYKLKTEGQLLQQMCHLSKLETGYKIFHF